MAFREGSKSFHKFCNLAFRFCRCVENTVDSMGMGGLSSAQLLTKAYMLPPTTL